MDAPPLSPYPFVRTGSPRRIQLSQNHPIYISPHKNEMMLSPREKIFYYFSNSPSKVSLTCILAFTISKMVSMLETRRWETLGTQIAGSCQRKVVSKSQWIKNKEGWGKTLGLEIELTDLDLFS